MSGRFVGLSDVIQSSNLYTADFVIRMINMNWAADEMKTVNLGDKRLHKRLLSLFDQLGNSPNLSIPAACGGWHETKAAYRFFDHEEVTTESILRPHIESTFSRMKQLFWGRAKKVGRKWTSMPTLTSLSSLCC
ncbi:hypothetical protein BN59_03813 [Legionella massiliensis]|uniref:Transposase Tn5-like N-terminal domain-containing protein n=1 Tax=Legionella massiliensis TaxID=1034943 RepID=A0A078KYM7_9GAMM|nr:hypothetical protein BN59_03813 [Legionella massiliensis]CEE15233.1 hypothetical protein BN1094_03813 [Legionella massiliensis]